MLLHGIVQTATLVETPPESGNLEIILKVQGVGRGQPRSLLIPYSLLLAEASLDPDLMQGRAFECEAEQDELGRWLVVQIAFASRVLRPPE
jgi:hypothetical protein